MTSQIVPLAGDRQLAFTCILPVLSRSANTRKSENAGEGFSFGEASMGIINPKIAAYEAAKRAWIAANPGYTADQYEAACKALAKQYGI